MRIDYCPCCFVAGLRYDAVDPLPEQSWTPDQILTFKAQGMKWCRRCKKWVKPTKKEW